MVALLKGINVGGNRKVSMTKLVAVIDGAGFTEVKSYINSGNLVFYVSKMGQEEVVSKLEKAIENEFGFRVDVIVRTTSQWSKYSTQSPFPTAESTRPNKLHLGLSKATFDADIIRILNGKAQYGEKIKIVGDAIWVDFNESVGKSKLTPAFFDRTVGSTVTMRNWNTVQKLNDILNE